MATTILAVGSTTASSSDITIPAGESVVLRLFGAASGPVPSSSFVQIEYKTGSVYTPYADLTGEQGKGATILDNPTPAAMVYRVTRNPNGAGGGSVGVALDQS